MRVSPLTRRLSYGALSAGLLAAALVPLTASAAAATCPSYVDDAEDSGPDPALAPITQDGQLDILSVTHSTTRGMFSTTFALTALNDYGSDYSIGDWYEASFTVVGKVVAMRAVRDANVEGTTTTRLQVDGVTTDVKPEAAYDFDGKTVTLTVKQADLEKAVEAKLAGKPLTAMGARSLENYKAFGLAWDFAEAPEGAVHVFGTACKAGAAPKPAPSPTASAGASPSAGPSASPSASGSPSASASPSASPSPSGPPPPPEPSVPVPADGCFGFPDEVGDSDAAVGPAGAGDDPDLDLVSVTGRTTGKDVFGHLGVAELSSGPSALPVFTGHRFEYEFSVGERVVVLSAEETGPGTGTVDGAANETLLVKAVFDEPSSQVVLGVDRASLVKALGTSLPDGAVLSGTAGRSYALSPASSSEADTASPEDPRQATYVLGDNACFRPALSVTAPGDAQTSDVALVGVALTTSDGRVAKGQAVTGRIGSGRTASATTDASGLATLRVPVTDAAGTRELVVRSSGTAGDGELRSSVRVLVEQTRLALRSTGGTVTATLTDDDGRTLSGQRLAFAFGGRTVSATTDGRGRAAVSVPAGTAVEVSYAGRSGYLAPVRARVTA